MKNETIPVIGNRILARVEGEFREGSPNKAIAHIAANFDGTDMLIWLLEKEIGMATRFGRNIHGEMDTNSHEQGNSDFLRIGGKEFSKNSWMGGFLIMHRLGSHQYQPPTKGSSKKPIDVYSFSQYVAIEAVEYEDAINGVIMLKEGDTRFSSLRNLLKELAELESQRNTLVEELKHKEEGETEILKAQVAYLEEKIKVEKEGIKRYINKNVELRYLPILDAQQEAVKRSSALFGSLIINGGPGTGKTTTLIQRIKYLTSIDILDNEVNLSLSDEDRSLLFDQRRSWIFFSPTELLKDYLKEAMTKEGLEASNERVYEWGSFLVKKVREYKLVNTETNRPFLFLRNEDRYFKQGISESDLLLTSFDDFYFQYNRAKLDKVISIDIKGRSWEKLATDIIGFINRAPSKLDYNSLIRLYFNLKLQFESGSDEVNDRYKSLLESSVAKLMYKVKNEKELAAWFEAELLKNRQARNQPDDEEDEEDELEEENFDEAAEVVQHFNFDLELSRKLKSVTRKVALRKFDANTKLTKKDRPFYEKVAEYYDDNSLNEIGEKALFKKYFDRLIKGVEKNSLLELPTIYKKFRKERMKDASLLTPEGLTTLDKIFKQRNIHLHKEELALLVLKINNIVKHLFQSYNQIYSTSTNNFIRAYRDTAKAVVAIDEATDFSAIDLACMSSFSHPRFNAVTLCGDIMQRLEKTGISSWEEYKAVVPNTSQKDLNIAFRQTPLLFGLAKKLYTRYTNQEPDFRSYQSPDENDPKPLLLINSNRDETAEWIGDRIIEIHNRYGGNTPSIAVFAADEADISSIATAINNHERLQSFEIKAVECPHGRVLGSANNVRVYSVKYIKGLEFEAVFFVDTDKIQSENEDMVDKYLYVGLSRATYFLAVTAQDALPERLEVIRPDLHIDSDWTMI